MYDNGPEFTSEFVELLHSYSIKPPPTTIKKPQANTVMECIHLIIVDSICTMDLANQLFNNSSINKILTNIAWGI